MTNMQFHRVAKNSIFILFGLLALALTGCLGWADMFAPKHAVAGDYYLMQGEDGENVYLFIRGNSVSIAGPIRQVGWSRNYIVFTDDNRPSPWNVIRVSTHQTLHVSEEQRGADHELSSIRLLSPSAAWKAK